MKRFRLVEETYNEVIRDVEHGQNFLFLAGGGMGVNNVDRRLARKVVDFLNSLPSEDTLPPYPYNVK